MSDLLRIEMDTRWERDDRGRLVRARTHERRPAPPLLAVATDGTDLVWAVSTEVPEATTGRIAALLAGERPTDVGRGWAPGCAAALLAALAPAGGSAPDRRPTIEAGPSFVVVDPPPPPIGVALRTSADPDAEAIRAGVPEPDRDLSPPWVIALVDGEVAAVCETARDAAASVEAGVWTYEAHRRRGLATAVVATWAALVADRTAFYGTTDDNHASQGVARRLGLRPLGRWWWVRAG